MNRLVKLISLRGNVQFVQAWKYQKILSEYQHARKKSMGHPSSDPKHQLNSKILAGTLLMLEHESVYTIGKGGDINNIRFSSPFKEQLYRIERGGDATWHGPGQLVIYPILDLSLFKKDLHWFDYS